MTNGRQNTQSFLEKNPQFFLKTIYLAGQLLLSLKNGWQTVMYRSIASDIVRYIEPGNKKSIER